MPEAVPPTDPAAPASNSTPDLPPALQLPAVERRRGKRLSSTRLLHCLVSVAPGEPMFAAILLDVSRWGAGLIAFHTVPPGAALVVHLPDAGGERPAVELAARAVHCGELARGRHLLGVEFVRPLAEEQLGAVLARMKRRPGRATRPQERKAGGRQDGGRRPKPDASVGGP